MGVKPIENIERKKNLRTTHPEIETTLSMAESWRKDKPFSINCRQHDPIFETMNCALCL
jgi:hypothetical protein